MPNRKSGIARLMIRRIAALRPRVSICLVNENTNDTPAMNTNIGKIRSSKANPSQGLCCIWLPSSLRIAESLSLANWTTIPPAPRIQIMSNPRKASSDINRPLAFGRTPNSDDTADSVLVAVMLIAGTPVTSKGLAAVLPSPPR